jgi:IMP dehydrogenase
MPFSEHIDAFMRAFPHDGLTFDDVSLVTQYANFLPHETTVQTRLTSRIQLNIPYISAAMDTVTETEMAVAMALLGGIGIIHKNLTTEQQARQVGNVKHHLHGLIRDPIIFHDTDTVSQIMLRRKERGFSFSGFPILNAENKLVGILTSTDVRYAENIDAKVSSIMTKNVITASPDTDLQQAYDMMIKHKIGKLPLVDSQGQLTGLYSFSDVSTLIRNVEPLYNRDSRYRLRVGAAVSPGNHERVEALAAENVDVIVVDSAHGHSEGIIEMTRWITKNFPDIDVIAGNIATAAAARALADAGAHAVKVGIGPGSICTTRVVCGVGVPQITAIYAASRELKGAIPVIADGGIRLSGDVPKAIAAGADSVMLGSILAGTAESPGEKIIHQGRQYVAYRGMGSLAAMQQGIGSRERYGQSDVDEEELVPQGIEGMVPYAGTVKSVMTQFTGGLRSALGYCGCRNLSELHKTAQFTRVSAASIREAHPHDVKIMKDAPNYRS